MNGCAPPLLAFADASVLEVGFQSESADRFFVGSSPYARDLGTAGVPIPAAPLTGMGRYLFCLAAYAVGRHEQAILWGLRQLLTIGNLYPTAGGFERINIPVEGEWSFPDGNVSWHLVWVPGDAPSISAFSPADPAAPVGSTTNPYGPGALLYEPPFAPYTPPFGARGLPASGIPVPGFGTFYDVRFPSRGHGGRADLAWRIPPGGTLFVYASVKQTSIATRELTTIPTAALPYVRREDAFVQTNVQTFERTTYAPVYDTIGATLIVETDAIGHRGVVGRPARTSETTP